MKCPISAGVTILKIIILNRLPYVILWCPQSERVFLRFNNVSLLWGGWCINLRGVSVHQWLGLPTLRRAVRQCGAWLSSKILSGRLYLVLCPFVPKTTGANPFCSENCEEHPTRARSPRYSSSLTKCAGSWEPQEVLVQAITHKSGQYYGYFCSHAFIKDYIRCFKCQEKD